MTLPGHGYCATCGQSKELVGDDCGPADLTISVSSKLHLAVVDERNASQDEAEALRVENAALRAERDKLAAKLDLPCGSCHPCMNWRDEEWRREDRKPPYPYEWDETKAALADALRERDAAWVDRDNAWRRQMALITERDAARLELTAAQDQAQDLRAENTALRPSQPREPR